MSYLVKMHTGESLEITAKQYEQFLIDSTSKKAIVINGQYIAFSAVATVKEFGPEPVPYTSLPAPKYIPFTKQRHVRIINSLIRGLRKYANNVENPSVWSVNKLTILKEKLAKIESEPDNKIYSENPIKSMDYIN